MLATIGDKGRELYIPLADLPRLSHLFARSAGLRCGRPTKLRRACRNRVKSWGACYLHRGLGGGAVT